MMKKIWILICALVLTGGVIGGCKEKENSHMRSGMEMTDSR